jgi:RNA polymerase sigma factor (sigma-70 family)
VGLFEAAIRQPRLSHRRFLELHRQYKAGDADAHDRLIEANLRLVLHYARRCRVALDLDDRIQAGILGLIKAIDRFDATKGCLFSTYAMPSIVNEIYRAGHRMATAVPVPVVTSALRLQALHHAERYFKATGLPMTLTEACHDLGFRPRQTECVLAAVGAQSTDELTEWHEDSIPDERDDLQPLHHQQRDRLVDELLATLDDRNRTLIAMRFGLLGYPECQLQHIAEEVGVGREKISAAIDHALSLLRHSQHAAALADLLPAIRS